MQIPKYVVLENVLRDQLRAFTPGEKLPSEEELAGDFGVSRVTLQRALLALVNDGVISRQQGKGTFYVGDGTRTLQELSGALESLMVYEGNADVRIIDKARWTQAPSDIREHLGIGPNEPVVVIKRLLVSNGVPMTYLVNFLPRDLGDKIFDDDRELTRFPILTLLRDKYNVPIVRAAQTIEAVLADPLVAEFLTVPIGSPLLFVERTFFAKDEQAAQFTRSWYVSRGYKYTVELRELNAAHPPPSTRAPSRKASRPKKR